MKVYRVETVDGEGPYCVASPSKHFTKEKRSEVNIHRPAPYNDSLLKEKWDKLGGDCYKFIFGFKSKKQLKEWFPPYALKTLFEENSKLRVSIYDASEAIKGEKQVVFKEKSAVLVKSLKINEFLSPTTPCNS